MAVGMSKVSSRPPQRPVLPSIRSRIVSFWDDIARTAEVDANMCHVPVDECLIKLAPVFAAYPPGDVLDLGCGVGRLTQPLASAIAPHMIYGVDSSVELLSLAYQRWQHDEKAYPNVQLLHNDGRNLTWLPDELAAAFSIGMFQHVSDSVMVLYLQQVTDLLRPGGVFVYQFVYDGEEGPLSYIRDYDVVRQWGIIPTETIEWDEENKWCWVTGVKP